MYYLRANRGRGESGQTMLEAALVLTPFLAIFFALMDFTMAIFLKNTVQYAVRQGVRYAITSQVQTDSSGNMLGHDASIKNVVSTNAMGFLTLAAPSGTGRPCSGTGCIAIQYYRLNSDSSGNTTLTAVSGAGSNSGGNIVEVTANNLTYAWMVPLLRSATALSFYVSSADVMEGSPVSGIPAR
jgi:Flp pilus assembly protein TadG